MGITSLVELFQASGEWSLEAGNKNKRNYTRYFLAKSDSPTDSAIAILLDKALPQLGEYFKVGTQGDSSSVVTNIHPQRAADNPYHWTIEIRYEIIDKKDDNNPPPQNSGSPTDPRNLKPEISTSWATFQTPVYADIHGNPVVNSCGQPFSPPPNVDDYRLLIHIVRYEGNLDINRALQYRNAVNSDVLWNQAAGTLKMHPITATQETIDEVINGVATRITYFKQHYTIELNQNGWGLKPVDRGLCQLANQADNGTLTIPCGSFPDHPIAVPILSALGTPITTPCLLDGHGAKLAIGGSPVWVAFGAGDPPPSGARLAKGYEVYSTQPFKPLNLPVLDIAGLVGGVGGGAGPGPNAAGQGGGGGAY